MMMPQSARPSISSQCRPGRAPSNTGLSHWSGPGVFVRLEFGVAFTPAKTKRLSVGYASKGMEPAERQHPASLVPGNGSRLGLEATLSPLEENDDHMLRRRRIRSRSALQLRTSPVDLSPVSMFSPDEFTSAEYQSFYNSNEEQPFHPSPVTRNQRPAQQSQGTYHPSPMSEMSYPGINNMTFSPSPHRDSYATPAAVSSETSGSWIPPFHAVRQSTADRKSRPTHPSRFRLGEEGLPWNSPTPIPPADYLFAEPSRMSLGSPEMRFADLRRVSSPAESMRTLDSSISNDSNRLQDPQHNHELGQLHQAMLGIDSMSLNNDWWEPAGSWDQLGEIGSLPRGPRGVGWAIAVPSREETDEMNFPPDQLNDVDFESPPPYTPGQWGSDWEWEESFGYWVRGLRRSNSVS